MFIRGETKARKNSVHRYFDTNISNRIKALSSRTAKTAWPPVLAFDRDMKYQIETQAKGAKVPTNANENDHEPDLPPPLLAGIFKALRPYPEACAAVECLLAQHLDQTTTNAPKPPENA